MSDRVQAVRGILRQVTDPECEGYVTGDSMEQLGAVWAAAFQRVCAAVGKEPDGAAVDVVRAAVAQSTPAGMRWAAATAILAGLRLKAPKGVLDGCSRDTADWTGALAAHIAKG